MVQTVNSMSMSTLPHFICCKLSFFIRSNALKKTMMVGNHKTMMVGKTFYKFPDNRQKHCMLGRQIHIQTQCLFQ